MVTKEDILTFIKRHRLAVISTVTTDGKSESAAIEFGENDNFELIFDAFENSRKIQNLRKNPHVSLVIGWGDNITVQYEGVAELFLGGVI